MQVNLYSRKDFKSLRIGSLYEKYCLILNELKTSLILKFSLQSSLQSFESLFLILSKGCQHMVFKEMNVRFVFLLLLVTRERIIDVLFNDFTSIKNGGYAF